MPSQPGSFIKFDTITLVPFEPKLIDYTMMTAAQIQWLNDYNAKIVSTVLPHFVDGGNTMVADWIRARTAHIDVFSNESEV